MAFGGDDDQITEIADSSKAIVYGPTTNYANWLASRGVHADTDYAYFGPGGVDQGYTSSGDNCFYSGGASSYEIFALRAVVSLRSNIPEQGEILFNSFTYISVRPAF